jgi:hypothetical protein
VAEAVGRSGQHALSNQEHHPIPGRDEFGYTDESLAEKGSNHCKRGSCPHREYKPCPSDESGSIYRADSVGELLNQVGTALDSTHRMPAT